MNKFLALAAAVVIGFTVNISDAEARRLGGGSSLGMKRQATPPAQNNVSQAPRQQQAAAAPQTQPKRSWMGPIAGLAAGLGLAALASHLGFGEGFANFLMIALLAVVAIAAIRFFLRKNTTAQGHGLQYAGANPGGQTGNGIRPEFTPASGPAFATGAADNARGSIPADFDAEGFARSAKVNFIRLQAANDAGNLDDIREFTSPEMFAEIKLAIAERQGANQETDVVHLDAQVIDVAEEASRYIVSVHFSGQIREEKNGPVEQFSEIWHMTKPTNGSHGWVIAGIQQVQ
ncbi:Tim44-like domain-containing protein [Azonexus sp.]|jgi:predicted lipid-binding transport protein (Tim44 family)|uniref:Tim44 domain-containing protein n=1 Tax=Azonexus sp. TaxID=1872668 RepID=UPI00283A60A0|nr:Tim44-like domain-containing protein [Azonexus sp.]MDR1994120.1 39S ribosomal protein L45 [Azonexus sp.]